MSSKPVTISIALPDVLPEPDGYVNPGSSSNPFAVLTFSPNMWLYISDPGYLRTLVQVASRTVDQLEDAQRRASETAS